MLMMYLVLAKDASERTISFSSKRIQGIYPEKSAEMMQPETTNEFTNKEKVKFVTFSSSRQQGGNMMNYKKSTSELRDNISFTSAKQIGKYDRATNEISEKMQKALDSHTGVSFSSQRIMGTFAEQIQQTEQHAK